MPVTDNEETTTSVPVNMTYAGDRVPGIVLFDWEKRDLARPNAVIPTVDSLYLDRVTVLDVAALCRSYLTNTDELAPVCGIRCKIPAGRYHLCVPDRWISCEAPSDVYQLIGERARACEDCPLLRECAAFGLASDGMERREQMKGHTFAGVHCIPVGQCKDSWFIEALKAVVAGASQYEAISAVLAERMDIDYLELRRQLRWAREYV